MRGLWSQSEEAWRDTLVHRAEGTAFDDLSRLYGIPRPTAEIPEYNWRGVLSQLAYGRRGTFQDTYVALQKAFAFLNEEVVVEIQYSSGIILVGAALALSHQNRLVKIGERIFFTQELAGATLRLVPIGSLYWDAGTEDAYNEIQGETVIQVLPFVVHERTPGRVVDFDLEGDPVGSDEFSTGEGCLVELIFFVTQESLVPKTWLQDPDYAIEADVYTATGVPYGGQALTDETVIGNPEGTGPHPLYAYDGDIYTSASRIFSSTLAASVELKAILNPPPL